VIHLGEIVVFGREPEYRDCLNPARGETFRGSNGFESFVKGVCRTAEKANLLAGDNGDRSIRETIEIRVGGWA
jgi:hypothetical protein